MRGSGLVEGGMGCNLHAVTYDLMGFHKDREEPAYTGEKEGLVIHGMSEGGD